MKRNQNNLSRKKCDRLVAFSLQGTKRTVCPFKTIHSGRTESSTLRLGIYTECTVV